MSRFPTKNIALFSIILIGGIISLPAVSPITSQMAVDESSLTIYTYASLLSDPGYDYIGAYANYSGIPADNIQLVAMSDANSLITRLLGEKDSPVADVVIGLDNILIHEAKAFDLLTPYSSPELVNITSDLITNLDPDHYLLPYDYGIIAFNYDALRINSSTVENLTSLTLEDILTLDLDKNLVVEDPTLSSPGLGFLLWTIAVFGDPSIDFPGLLEGDWRDWWSEAAEDIRVANSWTAAFDIFDQEAENRPIMISYGSSPAYTVCQGWGDNLKAFTFHELNQSNAWLQIEGIGIVNGAPHESQAQHFIDWFLGEDLQSHIPENNWMYPANENAEISSCFEEAALNPSEVNVLNNLITPSMIESNLGSWKTQWEEAMAGETVWIVGFGGITVPFWIIFSFLGIIIARKSNPHHSYPDQ